MCRSAALLLAANNLWRPGLLGAVIDALAPLRCGTPTVSPLTARWILKPRLHFRHRPAMSMQITVLNFKFNHTPELSRPFCPTLTTGLVSVGST